MQTRKSARLSVDAPDSVSVLRPSPCPSSLCRRSSLCRVNKPQSRCSRLLAPSGRSASTARRMAPSSRSSDAAQAHPSTSGRGIRLPLWTPWPPLRRASSRHQGLSRKVLGLRMRSDGERGEATGGRRGGASVGRALVGGSRRIVRCCPARTSDVTGRRTSVDSAARSKKAGQHPAVSGSTLATREEREPVREEHWLHQHESKPTLRKSGRLNSASEAAAWCPSRASSLRSCSEEARALCASSPRATASSKLVDLP